ncbi:MAG: class F sortase [Patescibacteria group bacterium]
MQSKNVLKRFLFILGTVGLVSVLIFFFWIINFPTQSSYAISTQIIDDQKLLPPDVSVTTTGPGLPLRLKIPKIKVDATVDYVGLTPDGAMGVPKIPRNVAWYNLGPRPGEVGSAAIAGHVNWYNGAKAVFVNLSKLKKGDKIFIVDDRGATSTFVVRRLRSYRFDEDAPDVFSSDDRKAHLNLITCIGVWNKKLRSYSKRLVVFADEE